MDAKNNNNANNNSSLAKMLQPYICGGSAAIFASICVQPADIAKTRLQLLPKGTSMVTVMRGIVAKDGVTGLYAGMSASIMRQAVYGTARLGLHREFSERLRAQQGGGDLSALASAGSAMVSGALASVIGTPMDVCMVRMQADGMLPAGERRGYKNVFDALVRIARAEGVGGLWQGFEPTAFRAIAMNVGMMASFDQAKQAIKKVNGDNLTTTLSASAISASCASITSLPFDLIKTQLQNQKPGPDGTLPFKGVLDCASKILAKEGPLAFWKGLSAYYVSVGGGPCGYSAPFLFPTYPSNPPILSLTHTRTRFLSVPHCTTRHDCFGEHGLFYPDVQATPTIIRRNSIC
jgi:solute carrier family 25 oxoglutarate transporter 11